MVPLLEISSEKSVALFGVDHGLVDGIPTGCGDTPVVGGILVAVDANLRSFDLFVGIDTHGV